MSNSKEIVRDCHVCLESINGNSSKKMCGTCNNGIHMECWETLTKFKNACPMCRVYYDGTPFIADEMPEEIIEASIIEPTYGFTTPRLVGDALCDFLGVPSGSSETLS